MANFPDINELLPWLPPVGALFFGAVVGWMAHHVFQQATEKTVTWLGTMISVVAGGAVTRAFDSQGYLFGAYCVGLGLLFFIRVITSPISKRIGKEMDKLDDEEARKAAEKATQAAPTTSGN